MSKVFPRLTAKWSKGDATATITIETSAGTKKRYELTETHVQRFASAMVALALQMEQAKPGRPGNHDPHGITKQSLFPATNYAAGINAANGKGWVSFRVAMAWMGFEMDKSLLLDLAKNLPHALSAQSTPGHA